LKNQSNQRIDGFFQLSFENYKVWHNFFENGVELRENNRKKNKFFFLVLEEEGGRGGEGENRVGCGRKGFTFLVNGWV
jgi:hypothetical protein